MRMIGKGLLLGMALLMSGQTMANDAQMNETLVRIINQINALMPLIDEASREQPENPRIKIHFDTFEGADGVPRPGLRQDLIEIRAALVHFINKPRIEARTIKPLADDFIGR